jgi:hypothetical protein
MVEVMGARRLVCVAAALAAAGPVGCKNNAADEEIKEAAAKAALNPGAERWDGGALGLPAGSPVVVSARTGEVVRALDALYEWIVSEPAMLGADGEDKARALANLRETARTSLEMDLLDEAAWEGLGLDTARPMHLGLYPLSAASQKLTAQLEGAARAHLGAAEGDSLEDALAKWEEAGSEPGLHKALVALERAAPEERSGARVILPIDDEAQLLSSIDRAATQLQWRAAFSGSGQPLRRVFYEDDQGWIATARVQGDTLHVDLFGATREDGLAKGSPAERVREVAEAALTARPAGYPAAPAAPGLPALAASLDQRGVSAWLRYSGVRLALERAKQSATSERDAEAARQLRSMARGLKYWDAGEPNLTGMTYGMLIGGDGASGARLVGGEMTLFGKRGLALPAQPKALASLSVGDRALGASLTASFLFGEDWRAWIGVEDTENLLEFGDTDGPVGTASMLGSLPRNLAMLVSNFESTLARETALESVPIHQQRDRIERIEFATTGLSLSGFLLQPQYVALVTIKPEVEPVDRDAVSGSLRSTIAAFAKLEPGEDEEASTEEEVSLLDSLRPLEPGKVARFDAKQLPEVTYFYERDASAPFIMIGNNLTEAELLAEVERARDKPTGEAMARSVYLRAEPVGLVELWSTFRPQQTETINLNVLAQRVGPITLTVDASEREGTGALRYALELLRPPRLE